MEPDQTQRQWRRSSRCIMPDNACVEVAQAGDHVHVRDSKVGDEAVLTFDAVSWSAFLAAVKAGDFDLG